MKAGNTGVEKPIMVAAEKRPELLRTGQTFAQSELHKLRLNLELLYYQVFSGHEELEYLKHEYNNR